MAAQILSLFPEDDQPSVPPSAFGFYDFWAAYPKRKGANPRGPAKDKFLAAVRSGVDPERIINSAKAYADELRETQKIGTEYVCQAVTWLNQRRYDDYAPDPGSRERNAKTDADMRARGWEWNGKTWVKTK